MLELFENVPPPDGATIAINHQFSLHKEDKLRVIFAGGLPIAHYYIDDSAARDVVIVQLFQQGGVKEDAIAKAFEVSRATVSRAKRKYEQGGVPALVPKKRGRKGATRIKGYKIKLLKKLVRQGESLTSIARRLGVTAPAVAKALKRLGIERPAPQQSSLEMEEAVPKTQTAEKSGESAIEQNAEVAVEQVSPLDIEEAAVEQQEKEAESNEKERSENAKVYAESGKVQGDAEEDGEPAASPAVDSSKDTRFKLPPDVELPAELSFDVDSDHRDMDRFCAKVGLLDDAAPLFGTKRKARWAGLLLAVPILVSQGSVADVVKLFGGIGPAFYGIRTTVMALYLMFFARINRPEYLKEHSPQELGAVLGLDRFPEMKTLRRKIRSLAGSEKSLELMDKLTERHLKALKESHLWLYVDGHVSVYSGKRKLKKHHVTRLRISMPAVLDYWFNDESGDPLFVATGGPEKSMVSLIPKQIEKLREQGEQRPITVVFDREGWSPKMFAQLDAMPGISFLSYRKSQANKALPRLTKGAFKTYKGEIDGQEVEYKLASKGIYVTYGKGKKRRRLRLRQITRLNDDGHQTHIVTNDWDSEVLTLAHRMFRRWGQENFFKYMKQEMEFDSLWTYLMEEDDGERKVDNPVRKKVVKKIKRLEKKREKLIAEYGNQALNNEESKRRTMRGFKIANGSLADMIRELDAELEPLRTKISSMPAKVAVKETLNGEKPMQAHRETRRLLHCFRIATFRAESALREMLRPHYRRWKQDGRTIIQSMLHSTGDIEVDEHELRVILAPQSSPHRTRALAALCDNLNQLGVKFPGSDLLLRFSVREV